MKKDLSFRNWLCNFLLLILRQEAFYTFVFRLITNFFIYFEDIWVPHHIVIFWQRNCKTKIENYLYLFLLYLLSTNFSREVWFYHFKPINLILQQIMCARTLTKFNNFFVSVLITFISRINCNSSKALSSITPIVKV